MPHKKYKIAMIGTGKLGLPCAEVMATKYDVVGYDVVMPTDPQIIMKFSIEDAMKGRDIIFIAVPTPHKPGYDGSSPITKLWPEDFDYSTVISVLNEVNEFVTEDQIVVLISTVLPGTVRTKLIPLLTKGKFVYNPYLIAMGSVKWDMVNPECLIIGTEDGTMTGPAKDLVKFYNPLMEKDVQVNVGTWDEAEAIKIFYNTFISAKVSLVNMVQDVAEKNGNINVDVVTDALKNATQRITGPKYMTAGMGDGGACVLPTFNLIVNNKSISIEDLYNNFNQDEVFLVQSATHKCNTIDQKKIHTVTKTPHNGDMIKIYTDSGELTVTPNHLIPVYRNRKLQIVRADEIEKTDKLYKL